MRSMKKTVNLNDPKDAKYFLTEILTEVLPSEATNVHYKDGTKKTFNEMNDEELVEAALHFLPVYQAAHPENVTINYEH